MRHCTVLGSRSEIATYLENRLLDDGWSTSVWYRGMPAPRGRWNLALIALGRVAPVGHWADLDADEWAECVRSNLMLPVELLRKMWPAREQDAAVCFMAGSNPNKVMDGYSPYNASKMALNKCCEQLDHESPDTKFFTLGPGYVATKIHHATRDAGWPNERIARGNPTPLDRIYDCLQWCLAQPKEVIGGRNICVTDPWGADLASSLRADSSLFKLRRVE